MKRMTWNRVIPSLLVAVVFATAGCSSRSEDASGSDTSGGAPNSERAKPFAGFVAPKRSYSKNVLESNVPIVMDDGVTLRADIYHPALQDGTRAPGRFPVIVVQHCYGKGFLSTLVEFWAYGYALVIVDSRGTGSSEGRFNILDPREKKDAYNVVEWAARQEFSNGKVGVDGFSYLGASAAMTAAEAPPSLVAASIGGAPVDIYRTFTSQGGNWASSSALWFLLQLTGTVPIPTAAALAHPDENSLAGLSSLIKRLLESNNSMVFRLQQALAIVAEDNNYDSAFWEARRTDVTNIEVPTLSYTGWNDLFMRDGPRIYRDLNMSAGRKQLLIGPWTHYSTPRNVGPDNTDYDTDFLVAWFDHWMKGEKNGVESMGPVTLWQYGTEKWTRFTDWPLADAQYQRLYLTGDKSGTSLSRNDGTLSSAPSAVVGADAGLFNAINGLCSRSTMQYLGGIPVYLPVGGVVPLPFDINNLTRFITDSLLPCFQKDDRVNELTAFTYTTAPLESDIRLAGPIALTLRGSTTAKDPTWVANLSDVAPDGTARPITEGALVASRRAIDPARSYYADNGDVVEPFHWHAPEYDLPVVPGEVYTYNLELWPTNWMLQKGHRLRLRITGAEFPHLLPTTDLPQKLGMLTVHFDPANPSFLSVPLAAGQHIR